MLGGVASTEAGPPRLFLTLSEAAEACGVRPDLLRGQVAHGLLRAKRTGPQAGGKYLFRVADLEAWYDNLKDA
jgi:hypothetical protein